MNSDWVKIYASSEIHKVEIVKSVLEDNNIASFEINKKDSSYISVGEMELYVKPEDEALATIIINTHLL